MVHQTKKSWRRSNSENSPSKTPYGVMCLTMPRTSSPNCLRRTKTRDPVLNRLYNIHGSWALPSYNNKTSVVMLQLARWIILQTSMPHQSLSRQLWLSFHPNFCQSRRKLKSIKSSDLWMSTETVSFPRKRSRTVMLNTSERLCLMSKSMRCSPISTEMEVERSTIQSSSLQAWTRRTYWAVTSSRRLSRCSIKMEEVQSLRKRSSKSSLSVRNWTKLSLHRSSIRLMRMEMAKSRMKNSLPWCLRTAHDIVR